MIALGLRYLTKYATATDLAGQRVEWPPHPGRVFLAMAAAHFETGADPEERTALEWLEAAPPPALVASSARERSLMQAYVPVNDRAMQGRQLREFRKVRPDDDRVFLIWHETPEAQVRSALDAVCRKVTRVGHSSSAVQMWVVPEGAEPQPNLVPGSGVAGKRMRVASEGTMGSLVAAFNGQAIEDFDALADAIAGATGKERNRLKQKMASRFGGVRPESRRPLLVHWVSYGTPDQELEAGMASGPFDPNFLVLSKTEGPALGLEPTLDLTAALRNAAMKAAGAAPPEWLTGHTRDGKPSSMPHAAFFPLPYVGGEYGDGHVMGLGLALPAGLDGEELRRVVGPLLFNVQTGEERTIALWNQYWRWTIQREARPSPPVSLRRETWTGPSMVWASVTPVVLHHYPKPNRDGDLERIVREAFMSAGWPEPAALRVRSVSEWNGAGPATALPQFHGGGPALCRYQTHVRVEFDAPVLGPMLVGRGRFRGYGLLRPVTGASVR